MEDERLYVMSPMEVAWGAVFGRVDVPPSFPSEHRSAREVLEQLVLTALQRTPCAVAFSGGRDSSLVLAVATAVARREGLAPPIPITNVFPDAPGTDETEWQELVLRHLGLREWDRIAMTDELDFLGPLATERLRDHGLVWPPTVHAEVPALERARGGALLDGEGGDETLGWSVHRVEPLSRMLLAPRPVRLPRIQRAARAVAPGVLRARWHRSELRHSDPAPWLIGAGRDGFERAVAREESRRPLSFAASVRARVGRRSHVFGTVNRRLLAQPYRVELHSPLLDPAFVDAIARDGGHLGRGDRTAVLRWMANDLLPDVVLSRTSKAEFGGAYWSGYTREFVSNWAGDGLDPELVDPAVLKRLWIDDARPPRSSALLQQAWLASNL